MVQLFPIRLGADGLVLLRQAFRDRQIEFRPADLLREEVAGARLGLGKGVGLHLGADHLHQLAELAAIPEPFELDAGQLDRDLDAALPASLFGVEYAP